MRRKHNWEISRIFNNKFALVKNLAYFSPVRTEDEKYMLRAISLARRALGHTSPNPPVGAVIVKGGKIVGEGYHHRAGLPHAEIEAINDAYSRGIRDFSDATMYVTLEPCSHYGKTPPCSVRLAKEKFRRVVIGTIDPNPKVSGRGIKILREAGVKVVVGVCEKKARELIEAFSVFITQKRAFCAVKYAQSLNGMISAGPGERTRISGEKANKFVHRLRAIYDAILVGAGTLLVDNPSLTVRLAKGRNPVRVIIAGRRKIPRDLRVFTDGEARTIVASPNNNPFEGEIPPQVELWYFDSPDGRVPIKRVLERLAEIDVVSVLCEGGAKIIGSAIAEKVVDKIFVITSPAVFADGVACPDFSHLPNSPSKIYLTDITHRKLGEDFLISGKIDYAEIS